MRMAGGALFRKTRRTAHDPLRTGSHLSPCRYCGQAVRRSKWHSVRRASCARTVLLRVSTLSNGSIETHPNSLFLRQSDESKSAATGPVACGWPDEPVPLARPHTTSCAIARQVFDTQIMTMFWRVFSRLSKRRKSHMGSVDVQVLNQPSRAILSRSCGVFIRHEIFLLLSQQSRSGCPHVAQYGKKSVRPRGPRQCESATE